LYEDSANSINLRLTNPVTPETERTTHVWFAWSRNFGSASDADPMALRFPDGGEPRRCDPHPGAADRREAAPGRARAGTALKRLRRGEKPRPFGAHECTVFANRRAEPAALPYPILTTKYSPRSTKSATNLTPCGGAEIGISCAASPNPGAGKTTFLARHRRNKPLSYIKAKQPSAGEFAAI